ncbi:histidine kinase dimerization/phospho-acceptor domain-containing protein [Sphingomonas sp. FW199]|uniref:sensor histidine kinase n=1 Tax=Sphingomonas sp. FW199 TaxID=3400217 RepID=UPI003CF985E9
MRFDDTLTTVLAADWSTPTARSAAWRQLVDLIGRGRAPADAAVLDRLSAIRDQVPLPVRVASASGLSHTRPPAGLVRLLCSDDPAVALPVLRAAQLTDAEWTDLLPMLGGSGRAVLRHRRDLSAAVQRALAAFGPADFVLDDRRSADQRETADIAELSPPSVKPPSEIAPPVVSAEAEAVADAPVEAAPEPPAIPAPVAGAPATPFQSLASVAMGIPVVAEAMRRAREQGASANPQPTPIADWFAPPADPAPTPPVAAPDGPFRIADVVALIDAHQRRHAPSEPEPGISHGAAVSSGFRFETDANGVIRVVEGVNRAPLIGLSLSQVGGSGDTGFDASAAGAWRKRSSFRNSRLFVAGSSDAAGHWLVSAMPIFDPIAGRFTGFAGGARRPRADERAEPADAPMSPADVQMLRELVHELRTPAGAITGFAELIESEMLGPVPPVYRERAGEIRQQARELIGIIDDLDLSARIEGQALQLYPGAVALGPVMQGIAADLAPLADLRGTRIELGRMDGHVDADRRAVERLLARLAATLVAHGRHGEVIRIDQIAVAAGRIALRFTRPAALAVEPEALAAAEADGADDLTPLGTRFTLRLVSRLSGELGGALVIDADSLTLGLPAADDPGMERTAHP